jgi:dTDP-4-dehydrorhamnose 3,5-epimerase
MSNGVIFTPLRRIPTGRGDVLHALKASDPGYTGFGEAYFSIVLPDSIKGWKRHRRMTMNLIVPEGSVRFVVYDEQKKAFQDFLLSPDKVENYGRLTVPPGIWMAFAGIGAGLNLVLNIASIEHDPAEAETCDLNAIPWNWRSPPPDKPV